VPKSSISRWSPRSLRAVSVAMTRAPLPINMLPVISSQRVSGDNPDSSSALATSRGNEGSAICWAVTLTETFRRISSLPTRPRLTFHSAVCRHASATTQAPRGMISSLSSANGMNSPGRSRPGVG